ncbi:MAG: hypothetical protein L0Y54_01340 [Sporichthyaceae bacterium]|nr:hypothetical protein [Sporichthyaceae bacterium]
MTAKPRWDIDTRGIGIASASGYLPAVQRLAEHMGRPGWVTEDADAHLLPHLLEACALETSPIRINAYRLLEDGTLELDCADTTGRDYGHQFRAVVALLAVIAESSFHVRRVDDTTIECVTGMLDGDGEFASHGHVIRLRLGMNDQTDAAPNRAEHHSE